MYRILLEIGSIKIYAWGTLIGIGFIIGLYIAILIGKKEGIKKDDIIDIALSILIAGIIGGRIAYIIGNWEAYVKDPIKIFYIQEGGLVFFGSLIGGTAIAWIMIKIKNLNFWKLGDILSPGVAIGLFIGRIGCFLNGCCWGKISYTFGIRFPSYHNPPVYIDQIAKGLIKPGTPYTLPVIPTQLLHSLSALIVFILIYRMYKKDTKKFTGQIFLLFIIYYSIGRFTVEFLRYYPPQKYIGPFTGSQILSLLAILWAYFEYGKRKRTY